MIIKIKLFAYPIHFTCGEEENLIEFQLPKELLKEINHFKSMVYKFNNSTHKRSKAEVACEMTPTTKDIAPVLSNELINISDAFDYTNMDEVLKEGPQQENQSLVFFYPHFHEYTYVSGFRIKNLETQGEALKRENHKIDLNFISSTVKAQDHHTQGASQEEAPSSSTELKNKQLNHGSLNFNNQYVDHFVMALLNDYDPFWSTAIAYMEHASNATGSMYLDPREIPRAMGHTVKFMGHQSQAETLRKTYGATISSSFGGSYYTAPGVIKDSIKAKKINQYIKMLEEAQISYGGSSAEKSCQNGQLLCVKTDDINNLYLKCKDSYDISKVKKEYLACLDLENKDNLHDNSMLSYFKNYLVSQRLVQMYLNPRFDGKDIAFKTQEYNGFDTFMGQYERVSLFRAGVNHYYDPEYGYQALNFMLNSFMTNTYLNKVLKTVEKAIGKKAKSILCQSKPKGYKGSIDSDHYHLKNQNSVRFREVLKKSWYQINQLKKPILEEELGLFYKDYNFATHWPHYLTHHYPKRKTKGLASQFSTWSKHPTVSQMYLQENGRLDFSKPDLQEAYLDEYRALFKSTFYFDQ